MNITEDHKKSQLNELSLLQLNAIDLLVQGRTDQEVADAVGVARETVNRWRNKNPYFQAELNRRRQEVWGLAHERLRNLLTKAVEILENSLEDGSLKSAVAVLRILSKVGPPSDPVDPELVLWQQAEEWAKSEFARRGPIENNILEFFAEKDIAELTRKRMEDLRREYLKGNE